MRTAGRPAGAELLLRVLAADSSPTEATVMSDPKVWAAALAVAERHRVRPAFAGATARLPAGTVPSQISDEIGRTRERLVRDALAKTSVLFGGLDALEEAGIDALAYKGPALAGLLGGDVSYREYLDVDLLVLPEDVGRSNEALTAAGFIGPPLALLTPDYLRVRNELQFHRDGVLLEVQWALAPRYFTGSVPVSDLLDRSISLEIASRRVRTLCLEDAALAGAVHAAKDLFSSLRATVDTAGELSLLDGASVGRVLCRARELGVSRMTLVSFELANRLLRVPLSASASGAVQRDRHVGWLAERFARQLFGPSLPSILPAARPVNLLLRERSFDRLRYAWRLLFDPGEEDLRTGASRPRRLARRYLLAGAQRRFC